MSNTLRITEIFYSLQGESRTVGLPTVFVRLTGCPLRCNYCDTAYAFSGGENRTVDEILESVASYKAKTVCVTGGEPLAQPDCLILLKALCDAGYTVSLETSGAMPVDDVDARVSKVMDLKTPSSTEVSKNRYENIPFLTDNDQVKFVIADRKDYDWSKMQIDQYGLVERVDEVLLSPSHEVLSPKTLAEWMLEDGVPYRMQLQLHKFIWGEEPGH